MWRRKTQTSLKSANYTKDAQHFKLFTITAKILGSWDDTQLIPSLFMQFLYTLSN